MAELLTEQQEDGVVVITLPDVLSLSLCNRLDDAVWRAGNDVNVRGIVLRGAAFGFDLEEPDVADLAQRFAAVGARIAASATPIIALLCGRTENEGLDLALFAHGRVASSDTTLAITRTDIGLIPGGGGTQRLPRRIGPRAALDLMLSREVWLITDARLEGLVDVVVRGDAEIAAIKLARRPMPAPAEHAPDGADFHTALSDAHARLPNPEPAERDIIDCVEAAQLLPLSQGLAFEMARFMDRSRDVTSRLLRHAALARARAQGPARPAADRDMTVVVMGRSSEAADLAAMALEQGHQVWIEAGTSAMGEAIEDLTRKRLRPQVLETSNLSEQLRVDRTGRELENADLILDTGELTPDPPVALKEGAVWVVTSPDIAASERAQEVLAVGKTLRMRQLLRTSEVVELSAPPQTDDTIVAMAHGALSARGQSVIITTDVPGGLLGALFCALSRAALIMLASGMQAGDVERAARDLGLRQGPLQMIDVLGAGRSLAHMRRLYAHRGHSTAPLRLLSDRMADVSDGDADRAHRALVFHAPAGQSFARDPDLADWLSEWRVDYPDRARVWPDVEPKLALLAALVSEAVYLLQNKVVQRASDIDLAAERGLFMNARRGGPLIQADLTGLLPMRRLLAELEEVDQTVWTCHRLITDMVKNGRTFF